MDDKSETNHVNDNNNDDNNNDDNDNNLTRMIKTITVRMKMTIIIAMKTIIMTSIMRVILACCLSVASQQPITSRTYQRLLYLLTNQIAHQGFIIFG